MSSHPLDSPPLSVPIAMPDPLRPQPASGAMGMAVGIRGALMDAEGPLALVMEHKPPASPPKVRM